MNTALALFATEAFYLAFEHKDIAAMDGLWSRQHPVLCVHPGWARITDRPEIIESWRNIFENPGQTAPKAYGMRAHDWGNTIGVTCYEQLEGGVILSTKVFALHDGQATLVMHHGGPCNDPPEPEQYAGAGDVLQ